jgi:hypothetical protein
MREPLVRTRRYSLIVLVLAALAADSRPLPGLTQSGSARIVRQVAVGQVGNHRVLAALTETEAGFEIGVGLLEEEGLFYFFKHVTEPHDLIVTNTPNSSPDGAGVLVLGADFTLSEYPIVVGANGLLQVQGPFIHGPFGDPIGVASLVSVSQLENHPAKENDPWVGIGTDLGRLILINVGGRVDHLDVGAPIADLVAVPQLGVFVALVNSRTGQRLIGIEPPPDDGTPARIVFDLQPLNPVGPPIVDLAASPPPDDSLPLTEPMPVKLVAVNNTRFIHRLTIPAVPSIGGTFDVESLEGPHVNICWIALDRLAVVPADGSGVLYDPGFTVDSSGVSSTLRTVLGNSLEVSPKTLSVSNPGQFVTAWLEVDNHRATSIDPASVELRVNGGVVPVARAAFTPRLGDADGDGNTDLMVRFDRQALLSLIVPPPDDGMSVPVQVMATWQFTDGAKGFASALITVAR